MSSGSSKIVIDTHIFLWYALGGGQLKPGVADHLHARHADVLVPTICLWEIAVLNDKGKIRLAGRSPYETIAKIFKQTQFVPAPLTAPIALLSRALPFIHEDPADRFIAATAYHHDAELLTVDEKLVNLPFLRHFDQAPFSEKWPALS